LTLDSIEKGVNKYFGHKCTFFGQRLYAILSKGIQMRRIFFNEFIERFYNVVIRPESSNREKSSFIFNMMDFDNDGKLGAIDLLKTFEKCSFDSKFGIELRRLILWYAGKNISDQEPVPGLKQPDE
jgi:Ca2+-binding EF-hand superfamily protein